LVFECLDVVENWLKGCYSSFIDGGFVRAGRIVVPNLLFNGVAIAGAGCRFQRLSNGGNVPYSKRVEGAPARLVRGNWIGLDPLAAGVSKKVGARIDCLVRHICTEALQFR